ncbi:hypothetical protein [Cereibacter sphaeroides]|uniref:hypothetical protein n=1 Tax=Cereibacter sphaeroides TaxID=1063 RepID=UPI0011AE2304|nr:hypothetical protein [Cereibacter sphaeroides]
MAERLRQGVIRYALRQRLGGPVHDLNPIHASQKAALSGLLRQYFCTAHHVPPGNAQPLVTQALRDKLTPMQSSSEAE